MKLPDLVENVSRVISGLDSINICEKTANTNTVLVVEEVEMLAISV